MPKLTPYRAKRSRRLGVDSDFSRGNSPQPQSQSSTSDSSFPSLNISTSQWASVNRSYDLFSLIIRLEHWFGIPLRHVPLALRIGERAWPARFLFVGAGARRPGVKSFSEAQFWR
jgi:hypothetical protein